MLGFWVTLLRVKLEQHGSASAHASTETFVSLTSYKMTSSSSTEVPVARKEASVALPSKHDTVEHEYDVAKVTVRSQRLRSLNWEGCIPLEITLAQSSLSSPSMPSPLYRMVPRQSYLHISLLDVIERLSMFAVASPALQQQNGIVNHTWLEDNRTKKPLRWHLFAGVLFDLSLPLGRKQQQLPWKLTLHFSSYPHDKILSLSNGLDTIRQYYFNSLKQSLYMQYGNAKKSTSEITKHHHDILWESLKINNYEMFYSVNQHLQLVLEHHGSSGNKTILLPVRVLVDSLPVIQKPYRITSDRKTRRRNNPYKNSSNNASERSIRSCGTLGDLLLDWLPHLFHEVTLPTNTHFSNTDGEISTPTISIEPKSQTLPSLHNAVVEPQKDLYCTTWVIQGITPSLKSSLLDLWYNLCHPDLFLYVIVRTGVNN